MSDAEIKDLSKRFRKVTNLDAKYGFLGNPVPWPGRTGYVSFREQTSNGLSAPRPVLLLDGTTIKLKPGKAVKVGWDEKGNEIILTGNPFATLSGGDDPVAQGQRDQSSSTTQADFETLRCIASQPASLVVSVKGWCVIVGIGGYEFPAASIDLSSHVPAAVSGVDQMRYVVVGVKNDYTTLEAADSTSRAVTDLQLAVADWIEAKNNLSHGSTPVWAIKLVTGQTEISQPAIDNDGRDLRQLVNTIAQLGGAPSDATYWIKDANADLPNAYPLSGINGLVKSTAGVPSAATLSDVPTPLTTKGDLLTYSTIPARLVIGANNSVLVADSTQTTGNKWTLTLSGLTIDNSNTTTLKDSLFTLQDDGDTSKQAKFQLSGISPSTTRTFTLPDVSDTLVALTAAQTLTNKTLGNTNTVILKDSLFTLQDDGDTSKQLVFQLSGIATGNTRTLTVPNASGTIALTSATGQGYIMQAPTTAADNTVTGGSDITQLTVKAFSTQTSDLVQLYGTAGTVTARITQDGRLYLNGTAISGGALYSLIAADSTTVTIPGSASNRSLFRLYANTTISTANQTGLLMLGAQSTPNLNQNGFNVTTAYSGRFEVTANGASGTITTLIGINTLVANGGAGTVTNARGISVASNSNSGGGTLTNAAGIGIDSQVGATNNTYLLMGTLTHPTGNWAIYSTTTAPSSFGGNIVVGGTGTPGAKLEIDGSSSTVGIIVKNPSSSPSDLQQWQSSVGANLAKIDSSGNLTCALVKPSGILANGATGAVALYELAGGSLLLDNTYAVKFKDAAGTAFNGITVSAANNVAFSTSTVSGSIQFSIVNNSGKIQFLTNSGQATLTLATSGSAPQVGLYGATPVVQATTALGSSTFVANTSGIANDTATWDGYTIGQIVKALRNIGVLA